MRRGSGPHIHWEDREVRAREGELVGRLLRVHGDRDGWPETFVVDAGAHMLALPAADSVLTREDVRLPYPGRRLAEARPLDQGAQDDPAAVGRAAAAFEDPSRTPIGEDAAAMTLSEERLDVSVGAAPVERVVLRKHLVAETLSVPVTVRREVVELVREPVAPDADVDPAVAVAEGDAADVILYEERPVVGVEVVPRERVRLVKSFTTEQVVVGGEVRREEATVDHLPPQPGAPSGT